MIGPVAPGGSGKASEITVELIDEITGEVTRRTVAEVLEELGEVTSKSDRFELLGFHWITASGTWDRAAFLTPYYVQGYSNDDLRLDIDVIGGGSSGQSSTDPYATGVEWGRGGLSGGVRRISQLQPSDLPALVNVVVGAGGAKPPINTNTMNAGGSSKFGDWEAQGGYGFSLTVRGRDLSPVPSDCPSYPPLAVPAEATRSGSWGPGAGGSCINGSGADGFDGDDGAADRPQSRTAGGIAGKSGGTSYGNPGQDAFDAWGFGAGGGSGLGSNGVNYYGGDGGFPGGGGGGVKADASVPGAGGNGAIRIRVWGRVGAVA